MKENEVLNTILVKDILDNNRDILDNYDESDKVDINNSIDTKTNKLLLKVINMTLHNFNKVSKHDNNDKRNYNINNDYHNNSHRHSSCIYMNMTSNTCNYQQSIISHHIMVKLIIKYLF